MPAKKTTKSSAKKTTTRRASPAKKKVTKPISRQKTPAKTTGRPAKKKVAKQVRTASIDKDLAYENLWEDDLTSQYPAMKKNNFLSLIVLWLGTFLVLIGIYIQVNKEDPATTIPTETTDGMTTSGAKATGELAGDDNVVAPTQRDRSNFPVDAQKMVDEFYSYFNNEQFDQMPSISDTTFTTDPGLVQYFSPSRLQNRKANIIGDISLSDVNAVVDHPIVQRNPNAMVVQYDTSYLLKQDGLTYNERWYAYILRKDGAYKINGFECQQNCAASPFFRLR